MLVNKTPPSDAYQVDADDDLKLTEVDGYYDLTRAMIKRAYLDSIGNKLEKRQEWIMDGIAFFQDGRAEHWCFMLGIDDFELLELDRR